MPFGLCNSPVTFERFMETILANLNWDICLVYIDDVIAFRKTFEESLNNLEKVFERLRGAGLNLKAKKYHLFQKQVLYLGYTVSGNGIETDPEKVGVVRDWPTLVSHTEVRSFLGLCSHYRRFIPKFADIARPLRKLTKQARSFK